MNYVPIYSSWTLLGEKQRVMPSSHGREEEQCNSLEHESMQDGKSVSPCLC